MARLIALPLVCARGVTKWQSWYKINKCIGSTGILYVVTQLHWDEAAENIIYLEHVTNIFTEKNPLCEEICEGIEPT